MELEDYHSIDIQDHNIQEVDSKLNLQPIIQDAIKAPSSSKANEQLTNDNDNRSSDDDDIINSGYMRRCCTNITCNGHVASCVIRDCNDNSYALLFKLMTFIFILILVFILTRSVFEIPDFIERMVMIFKSK